MAEISKLDQARLALFALIPHCAPDFMREPWDNNNRESVSDPSAIRHVRDWNSCYAYGANDPEINRDFKKGTQRPAWPVPGINGGGSLSMEGVTDDALQAVAITDGPIYAGKEMPPLRPGTYIVAAFTCTDKLIDPNEGPRGFHFLRLDRNGSWSEKNGTAGVNNGNSDGEPIWDLAYHVNNHPAYESFRLVGYFYMPNSGVALGRRDKIFCNPTSIAAKRQTPKTSADSVQQYIAANSIRERAA